MWKITKNIFAYSKTVRVKQLFESERAWKLPNQLLYGQCKWISQTFWRNSLATPQHIEITRNGEYINNRGVKFTRLVFFFFFSYYFFWLTDCMWKRRHSLFQLLVPLPVKFRFKTEDENGIQLCITAGDKTDSSKRKEVNEIEVARCEMVKVYYIV